jgi:hypothetical protein
MWLQGLTQTLSWVAAETDSHRDFPRKIMLQSANLVLEEPLGNCLLFQRQRVGHGIQHYDLGAGAKVRTQSRSALERRNGPGMGGEKDDSFLPSAVIPTRREPAGISFCGGLCCGQRVHGNHLPYKGRRTRLKKA